MRPPLLLTPVDPSLRFALLWATQVVRPESPCDVQHMLARRQRLRSGSPIRSRARSSVASVWNSMRSQPCASSDESGSIVLGVGVLVLAMILVLAVGAVGAGVAAYVQAAGAADAAALAAAPVTFRQFGASGSPASEAARFATANGTRLISCSCPVNRSWTKRTVTAVVARSVRISGLGPFEIRATSRATFEPAALLQP